jgi:hypothetical protein
MRMVDPVIIGDIDGSGALTGIDASFVAQKAAFLPRPEIPDLPGVLPPLVGGGVDPLISGGTNVPGRPGGTANFPVNIDDATNTYGYNVVLDYNTSLIDVADDVAGVSADVTLGSVYASAGGWSLVTNVDDASGHIVMVYWRSNGIPMPSGSGPIANITAHVSNTAIHNQSIPVQVSGPMTDQGLTFSHQDGNILVDAVPPAVLLDTYHYQTSPHTISFKFTENVSASLTSSDLTVHNVTTSSNIPSAQFTVSYDSLNNIATFTYTGGTFLPDGDYTATLNAAGVTDAAGNPLPANFVSTFFFLQGDANHDRAVNLLDFNILASNFGQSPRDFTQGDFTYNGTVDLLDFNVLAGKFGQTLGPDSQLTPPTGNVPRLPRSLTGGATTGGTITSGGTTAGGGTSTASSLGGSSYLGGTAIGGSSSLGSIGGSLPIPTAPSGSSTSRTSSSFSSTQVLASSVSPTSTSNTSGTTRLGADTTKRSLFGDQPIGGSIV